jgi:hypothetical protein
MNALKNLMGMALVAVVAIIVGVALTDPLQRESIGTLGLLVALLVFPLVVRYYGYFFAFSISSGLTIPFVPGAPYLWVGMAAVTLGLAALNRTLRKQQVYLSVPEIVRPLLCFAAVVVVTMLWRGVGGQAFGSNQWGARRYYLLLGAVVAYFAFACLRVPRGKARLFAILFFGSGVLLILTDLAFWAGGAMNWIFLFFNQEAVSANVLTESDIGRSQGAASVSLAVLSVVLCTFGLRRLLEVRSWWLVVLLGGVFAYGLSSGFRSTIGVVAILVAVLVGLERLYRLQRLWPYVGALILSLIVILTFSESMPLSVQRAISFLPVDVDPIARMDGENSTTWRLELWKFGLHEVPHYLWIGKGFTYSGADMEWTQQMGEKISAIEWALVGSWYHSGPLTLIVCLGLPGTVTFAWFLLASGRWLKRQWIQSRPELRIINLFIYGIFLERVIFFVFFYGQIELDMILFTSLVGFSLAINGVPARAPVPSAPFALPFSSITAKEPEPLIARKPSPYA